MLDVKEMAAASEEISWRDKLNRLLNLWGGQLFTVVMVILDLLVVTTLVLIICKVIADPATSENVSTSKNVQTVETVFHIIQIGFLIFFLIEIILRTVASGKSIFYDKLQMFDSVVTVLTFLLYVLTTAGGVTRRAVYPLGYIIILRLWRFKRLYQSVVLPVQYDAEADIDTLKSKCAALEEKLQNAKHKHQNDVLYLRKKLATFKAKLPTTQTQGEKTQLGSTPALNSQNESVAAVKPQAVVSPHYTPFEGSELNQQSMSAPSSPTPRYFGTESVQIHFPATESNEQLNSIDSNMLASPTISTNPPSHMQSPVSTHSKLYSDEYQKEQLQLSSSNLTQTPADSPLFLKKHQQNSNAQGKFLQKSSAYRDSCQSLPNLIDSETAKLADDSIHGGSDRDVHKTAKQENIQAIVPSVGKVGISNLAFTASMTEEEFREIQRISQVPAILDAEGLPMTDL